MLDIANGVEYLHGQNVVHRDIKPANILLSGSPMVAKLTDFDFSKFLGEHYTTSRMTTNVGTQVFKAPEFFLRTSDNKLIYHRSVDIFAMGLTFLAMIQENEYLIPKLETPNDPNELSIAIGLILWEREMYGVEPLRVVKTGETEGEPGYNNPLEKEIRKVILSTTQYEPRDRASAPQVVADIARIIDMSRVKSGAQDELELGTAAQIHKSQSGTPEEPKQQDLEDHQGAQAKSLTENRVVAAMRSSLPFLSSHLGLGTHSFRRLGKFPKANFVQVQPEPHHTCNIEGSDYFQLLCFFA